MHIRMIDAVFGNMNCLMSHKNIMEVQVQEFFTLGLLPKSWKVHTTREVLGLLGLSYVGMAAGRIQREWADVWV